MVCQQIAEPEASNSALKAAPVGMFKTDDDLKRYDEQMRIGHSRVGHPFASLSLSVMGSWLFRSEQTKQAVPGARIDSKEIQINGAVVDQNRQPKVCSSYDNRASNRSGSHYRCSSVKHGAGENDNSDRKRKAILSRSTHRGERALRVLCAA